MKRSVEIHLGEESARRVGTLHYNQQGNRESSIFEYHTDWLNDKDAFPIEPMLRLIVGPQFHAITKDGSKFTCALADTEPDGWGRRVIMRDHAKRREHRRSSGIQDLPPLNSLDFLLAVDDAVRIGALRLKDAGVWQRPHQSISRATT